MGAAAAGEKQCAGPGGAAVERHVAHQHVGGHGGKAGGELGERPRRRASVRARAAHSGAAARVPPRAGLCGSSSGVLTGRSGATASRRSAPPITLENTGAATCPPMCSPAPGSSITTTAASRGALAGATPPKTAMRSEEHTSELQSLTNLVCRLLLEKKKQTTKT